MRYKGVIFDLDGVLCSTDEYHYRAWKALADSLGIPFDRTVNDRLRGVSREESLEIVLERAERQYSAEEKREFAARKNEIYRASLQNISEKDLAEGAKSTLLALKGAHKLAVGSSSKNTPLILARLGIRGLFDGVADGNCITHSKPHPEVFLKAAGMLGLSPAECLVVEDAESGIEAGIRGGFDTAAIGGAAACASARYTIRTLPELLPIVQ